MAGYDLDRALDLHPNIPHCGPAVTVLRRFGHYNSICTLWIWEGVMKKILIAGAALAALTGTSALAADMAVKAPKPAPPPPFSWTGVYIGAFAGAAWVDTVTTSDPCTPAGGCLSGVSPAAYTLNTSFSGGGEIGYNYQINPFVVLGVENKFGYLHLSGSVLMAPAVANETASTRIGNWFDAYTVRVGATDGHAMFFLEGGGATARITTGVVSTTLVTVNTTASKTLTGWAGGGGIEYAFDSHWSVKGEYLALGINSAVNTCGAGVINATGFNLGAFCSTSKIPVISTANVGVNYRF
jgi:outer membrane immunogenic protein